MSSTWHGLPGVELWPIPSCAQRRHGGRLVRLCVTYTMSRSASVSTAHRWHNLQRGWVVMSYICPGPGTKRNGLRCECAMQGRVELGTLRSTLECQ